MPNCYKCGEGVDCVNQEGRCLNCSLYTDEELLLRGVGENPLRVRSGTCERVGQVIHRLASILQWNPPSSLQTALARPLRARAIFKTPISQHWAALVCSVGYFIFAVVAL